MRLVLIDPIAWDYNLESVYQQPLGGSQSALCYLSEALARRGHHVTLLTNTTQPGLYRGVTCRAIATTTLEVLDLKAADVCIVANIVVPPSRLRAYLRPGSLLVLWIQNGPDQPIVQEQTCPETRDGYDFFVFVSNWQRSQFLAKFAIKPEKAVVHQNAVAPAFEGIFPRGTDIRAEKKRPPVLAYTSTPFRGLDVLLKVFPEVRKAVPGTRLKVFSSMKVYHVPAEVDADKYGALYRECQETEGVEYCGSVAQNQLAGELKHVAALAYPNTFAETSCIAVMEAMAAGCGIITSDLAALPETTAGFGTLITLVDGIGDYARRFQAAVITFLRNHGQEGAREDQLRRQVDFANAHYTWTQRAAEWEAWLADGIRQAVASFAGVARDATAQNNLGAAFRDQGKWDEAAACLQRALQLKPDYTEAHNNLGVVLANQGKLDEAAACFQRAVRLKPDYTEAYNNLGVVLKNQGKLDEAVACCVKALQLQPHLAEAHNNLGNALKQQGKLDAAVACYCRTLELKPDDAAAYSNLASALKDQGKLDEAVACCLRALNLKPDYAEAHNILAGALQKQGKLDEAVVGYRRALELKPDDAQAHSNLGGALQEQGKLDEAVVCYRRAVEWKPDYAEAYSNLGLALQNQGKLDEAIACLGRALQLKPNLAEAHNNLGSALKHQGKLDGAIACFDRAMQAMPDDPRFHNNLAFALWYIPGYDARAICAENEHWNERYAAPFSQFIQPHANDRSADRRLRIGYVSPDFRGHVVGRNLAPLFSEHDHGHFEIFCYSNHCLTDDLTRRFQGWADGWLNVVGVSDERLAQRIREDRIDILVDLTLHTEGQRLLVFARKPAPVQVTFAGYPGTTGLTAIDYRLTDPYLDPPDQSDDCYTEMSIRLPDTFWCYDPLGDETPVGALPAESSGHITFGCLNNFCKLNPAVLELWARVLQSCADARLVVLAAEGSHRQETLDLLAGQGVAAEHVTFLAPRPRQAYLESYHGIDIGLDTFPYNGHTTSLDALWMGVPVVTLVGETVVGRAGLSQLTNLGLPELIARTPQGFVDIATELAGDLPRLRQLRAGLRERMRASPLMDKRRFARGIEAAYVKMWQAWCARNGV